MAAGASAARCETSPGSAAGIEKTRPARTAGISLQSGVARSSSSGGRPPGAVATTIASASSASADSTAICPAPAIPAAARHEEIRETSPLPDDDGLAIDDGPADLERRQGTCDARHASRPVEAALLHVNSACWPPKLARNSKRSEFALRRGPFGEYRFTSPSLVIGCSTVAKNAREGRMYLQIIRLVLLVALFNLPASVVCSQTVNTVTVGWLSVAAASIYPPSLRCCVSKATKKVVT